LKSLGRHLAYERNVSDLFFSNVPDDGGRQIDSWPMWKMLIRSCSESYPFLDFIGVPEQQNQYRARE
jgi:hypothetical protein